MNLKNILYVSFTIFLFSIFNIDVYAASYQTWPGVSFEQIPEQYQDTEYCVYSVGNVYAQVSGEISSLYSNKTYIFLYDTEVNEVKFLSVDPGGNISVKSTTNGGFDWYKKTDWLSGSVDQKIRFGDTYSGARINLSNYLIENGSLKCKPLYFVETYSDLCIDYDFYTYTNMPNSKMLCDNSFSTSTENDDPKIKNIENSAVTGTYDRLISTECQDKSRKLTEIYENYRNSIQEPIYELSKLTNSEYQDGFVAKGKEYADKFYDAVEEVNKNLSNVATITKDSEGNYVYDLGNCKQLLEKDLNSLISGMKSGTKQVENAISTLELNAAKSGVTLSQEEKTNLDNWKESNTEFQNKYNDYFDSSYFVDMEEIGDDLCEGILGQDIIDFINKIFRWIQIIAPIFVIVMGGVEFAGAVLQDDKDALKKASNKFIKRLIIAVALFFIPLILSFLLEIFNDINGSNVSTCGIGE